MTKNSNKVKKNANKENNFKLLAENRYAKFQYAISETIEAGIELLGTEVKSISCLLYTSPSPRDNGRSRMPSSA